MTPNNLLMRRRMMMACGGWNGYVYRNGVWYVEHDDTKFVNHPEEGYFETVWGSHGQYFDIPLTYREGDTFHIYAKIIEVNSSRPTTYDKSITMLTKVDGKYKSLGDLGIENNGSVSNKMTDEKIQAAIDENGYCVLEKTWMARLAAEGLPCVLQVYNYYATMRVTELRFELVKPNGAPAAYKGWVWDSYVNYNTACNPFDGLCVTKPFAITAGHKLTIFTADALSNGCFAVTYKEDMKYSNYWWQNGWNKRTLTMSDNTVYIRCTFPIARLDECYIYDETDGVYIWKGAAVN